MNRVALGACMLSAALLRAGEFARYEDFLPSGEANKKIIWANADVNEIRALRATMNGAWIGVDCKAHAVIYDRTESSFTAQFQTVHGSFLKYTRYYFRQEGADIVAYGDSSGNSSATGDYGLAQTGFRLQVSTAKNNGAYGAYGVEVAQSTVATADAYAALPAQYALDREFVTFAVPDGGATVTNAISGEGEVMVTGAGVVSGRLGGFLTTEYRTVLTNCCVSDLEVVGGTMSGAWVPGGPFAASVQHVSRDATHLYLQLQIKNEWVKGVRVVFEQQGETIAVTADWGRYGSGEIGIDLSQQYRSSAAIVTSDTGQGYALRDLDITYRPCLTLAGGKSWAWGRQPTVVDNAAVAVTGNPLPANSTVDIRNGGALTLMAAGGSYAGGDSRTYLVGQGSTLRLNTWMALTSGGKVVIDGGTLEELNASSDYLNDCVVANGGLIAGKALRVGYAADANLRFEGPLPIELPCGFVAFNKSGTRINFTANVDTAITGGICDSQQASYQGATLVKQGAAQLTWHQNLNSGPVRVEAGTLRLAADDTLVADRGHDVTLAGGALAPAAEVSAGALTLAGDAAIDVTEGTLAFAASSASAWAEGARLTVTGSGFSRRSRKLRFGVDANGLTAAQLRAIRFADLGGDFAARLDGEGYLYAGRGLVVMIR